MDSRWAHDLPGGAAGYANFVSAANGPQLFARSEMWRTAAVARTGSLLSFASTSASTPDFLSKAPKPDPDAITPAF